MLGPPGLGRAHRVTQALLRVKDSEFKMSRLLHQAPKEINGSQYFPGSPDLLTTLWPSQKGRDRFPFIM